MDIVKLAKWKKDLIVKAWGKCKSIGSISTLSKSKSSTINITTRRSASFKHYLKRSFTTSATTNGDNKERKSKNNKKKKKKSANQVAPDGCFSVYVGPEKQRFVVRTEFANHPLFRMLLEEAESEYGYNCDGPILLPCDVDLFYKVACGDGEW
uniref:Small auxin up regulated protein n=1 Tax=Boehmeria nivea TaxID=83906 RepID=A0A172J276_BOENI|nr:small auxin up regulated protein [Boehmeria nivea]